MSFQTTVFLWHLHVPRIIICSLDLPVLRRMTEFKWTRSWFNKVAQIQDRFWTLVMTHDQECQNLNFPGHNCGQELKYSCSCKVGLMRSKTPTLILPQSSVDHPKSNWTGVSPLMGQVVFKPLQNSGSRQVSWNAIPSLTRQVMRPLSTVSSSEIMVIWPLTSVPFVTWQHGYLYPSKSHMSSGLPSAQLGWSMKTRILEKWS